MFYTHPEAETILPPGLAAAGERGWNWVELGLQIPYFFVSFTVEVDNCKLGHNIIFNQLRDVEGLIATSCDEIKDLEISLLSPGRMNGCGSYKLGKIKEIWKHRGGREEMFVMSDGERFHFPPDENGTNDQKMELVFSL